jgi:hypothetical protein
MTGTLTPEKGKPISIYDLSVTMNPIYQEIWTPKEGNTDLLYGWILPPTEETHDLSYISLGANLIGQAKTSEIPGAQNNYKLEFEYGGLLVKSDIHITAYEPGLIKFQNYDHRVTISE